MFLSQGLTPELTYWPPWEGRQKHTQRTYWLQVTGMEDASDQCLGERQEKFIQKSLKDIVFQDQQPPPKPSDLFSGQNWDFRVPL